MVCYHPLTAFYGPVNKKTGKRTIVFDNTLNFKKGINKDNILLLPCGQCIGCRLEKSRKWAIRCVHEATQHAHNCFITLTYNDDNLPLDLSLNKRHYTLFMKRLRKKFGDGIRFFACGEYGSLYQRPHYHAILFGFDFPDKQFFKYKHGTILYRSPTLEKLWPYGFSTVGTVTFESCAYVARYCLKKVTGDKADDYYHGRQPEYVVMSRRPGIARDWIDEYLTDVYPHDYVVIRGGIKCKPPRYYDKIYDDVTGNLEAIKENRKIKAKVLQARDGDIWERLPVKEALQKLKAEKLVRPLEGEL